MVCLFKFIYEITLSKLILFFSLVEELENELLDVAEEGLKQDWHQRQMKSLMQWEQHRSEIFRNVVIGAAPPVHVSCRFCIETAVIR